VLCRPSWCARWGDFCIPDTKIRFAGCCDGLRCSCGGSGFQMLIRTKGSPGPCQCKTPSLFGWSSVVTVDCGATWRIEINDVWHHINSLGGRLVDEKNRRTIHNIVVFIDNIILFYTLVCLNMLQLRTIKSGMLKKNRHWVLNTATPSRPQSISRLDRNGP